jgi:uncharacterized protein
MRVTVFLLMLMASIKCEAQSLKADTLYSRHVKDNFIITIKTPVGFSASHKYHHVYIVDGSIGIGDYILGKNSSWAAVIPPSCIIIAISHTGNWHQQRPRDFIPSDITKNSQKDFGNAALFYLFMKNELIPWVEKQMPAKKDRAFIGHSFGGLFCLYTLFKEDKLFDKHFAISPSVWANQYELNKIEEAWSKKNKNLTANVWLYAGGLEFLNKVLYSTRGFYSMLQKRNYASLKIQKKEFADANHFSVRKPSVDHIFDQLK